MNKSKDYAVLTTLNIPKDLYHEYKLILTIQKKTIKESLKQYMEDYINDNRHVVEDYYKPKM